MEHIPNKELLLVAQQQLSIFSSLELFHFKIYFSINLILDQHRLHL